MSTNEKIEDMNLTTPNRQAPVAIQPSKPNVISEAQRKRLEARIHEFQLDCQRVIDWITKAIKGSNQL